MRLRVQPLQDRLSMWQAQNTPEIFRMAIEKSAESGEYLANVGIGLVEISALATLIGATTAEALALGMRAFVGVPWATISTFGTPYAIKAYIGLALPDWARDSFGLRTAMSDAATGMRILVDLRKKSAGFISQKLVGVGLPCKLNLKLDEKVAPNSIDFVFEDALEVPEEGDVYNVFAYDDASRAILETIPASEPGDEMSIFQVMSDIGPDGKPDYWRNTAAFLISCFKIGELVVLYRLGAHMLWWATVLPWSHSFVSAGFFEYIGIVGARVEREKFDIVAGELPSALQPGKTRKIVLGLGTNVLRHPLWRFSCALGAFVSLFSLLCIFISLREQHKMVIYVWLAFQILWLLARILVFHAIKGNPPRKGIAVYRSWANMNTSMRKRVVRLIFGLGKAQVPTHPRGLENYTEDEFSARVIGILLREAEYCQALPVHSDTIDDIQIVGIVGDTVLRSTAWVTGKEMDNFTLYDSTLVFIRLKGVLYAIPAARVLSSRYFGSSFSNLSNDLLADSEKQNPLFIPRGTSNYGIEINWVYWIPLAKGSERKWLEIVGLKVKEQPKMTIMTQAEVSKRLQSGVWAVSLKDLDDLEAIPLASKEASDSLRELLMAAEYIS